MNWEAINATAQIISSIAVVASLWYLAVQVHRSTRVAKLTAHDSAAAAVRDVTKQLSENEEVARIWRVGLENLDALSADERARFYHVAFQFLKAMETIHFHYIYGLMDEQIWRGWWNLYRHYLGSPGLEYYWQRRHELFSERFKTFVESLERPPRPLTVGNLLGDEKEQTTGKRVPTD
ncbi:MAG TPA: hypothetical protein VGH08_08850 [Chthoniobacterales bacterium]|jgi:hypothetical protein